MGSQPEQKLPARIESYKAEGVDPPLPPVSAPHIYDMLMDAGPIQIDGMGKAPLGWAAIRAWRELTRTRVLPWEARLIRRLSGEYLGEQQAAEDRNRPPPWTAETITVSQRQADEDRLRAVLG